MSGHLLKWGHLNVRSLLPKLNDVRALISLHNFDIFCLSESWLNCTIGVRMDGYNLARSDRGARGGGVAMYVKNIFTYSVLDVQDSIEQLWVTVQVNKLKLIFGVLYRPPGTDYKAFLDYLEDSISLSSALSQSVFFCGDFNIDYLKLDGSTTFLCDFIDSVGFTHLIGQPTRVTETSMTLIDQMYTNDCSLVRASGVVDCHVSDHDLIFCDILVSGPVSGPTYRTFRDYKHIDTAAFHRDLESLPLPAMYHIDDINDKVKFLTCSLLRLFDRHAPFITRKFSKKPAPWLTDNVRLLMELRDRAKSRYRRTGRAGHWEYYKSLRNLTTSALRNEKRAYFEFISRDGSSRAIFRNLDYLDIKSKNRRTVDIPGHLSDAGKINEHFLNNIVDTGVMPQYINHPVRNVQSFSFSLVDVEVIAKIINNIKSTSVGRDGLNITMIRMCCPVILPFLTHIINSCILTCTFPDDWKCASVIPLPKVASPRGFGDLRPISILPTLSKILEKILFHEIFDFVIANDILPDTQSGFRGQHSCETALLAVTDDILKATDDGLVTVLALLDFSKAFDTVRHDVLSDILRSVGFSFDAVHLVASYLGDRTQSVVLGDQCSVPLPVSRGVPQGSVLGPLLFSIYTCNLPALVSFSSVHMYADDIQLYKSFVPRDWGRAIMEFNADLEAINNFSNLHNLRVNPVKSQTMLLGSSGVCGDLRESVVVSIGGVALPIVDCARDLGLILDNSFRYRQQVNKYMKNAYLSLRSLYPHRQVLSSAVKATLCEALVLSHFSFCSTLYGAAIDVSTKCRIQKIQNSCLRYIYGIRKFDHISHKLRECGWLDMGRRRELQALCLYHRIISQRSPLYLYRRIRFRGDVHSVTTRFRNLISPPLHRTSLFERSFSYNIYFLYNSLPEVYKSMSVGVFRRRLRSDMMLA